MRYLSSFRNRTKPCRVTPDSKPNWSSKDVYSKLACLRKNHEDSRVFINSIWSRVSGTLNINQELKIGLPTLITWPKQSGFSWILSGARLRHPYECDADRASEESNPSFGSRLKPLVNALSGSRAWRPRWVSAAKNLSWKGLVEKTSRRKSTWRPEAEPTQQLLSSVRWISVARRACFKTPWCQTLGQKGGYTGLRS